MNLEALYLRLPIAIQNAICSVQGWRIQRTRFGPRFWEQLRLAEERLRWSPQRIEEYRNQRLAAFVQHCARSVPYYRRLFAEVGLNADRVHCLEDLRVLPILTKPTVQEHYRELLSEAVPPRQRIITHTSGTTGGGLRFAVTLPAIQEHWAIWWRYRRWHGLEYDTWCGYFGGRSVVPLSQNKPPFWRYNRPGRQILFSGYHLSPNRMGFYVDELRRRRPPWLHGYPSLLALLAVYLLEKQEELGYPLRWITTGAENLLPQQVGLIERAFGVRPVQHYGMAEGIANFSECPMGKLHVDEDFAATEFVPDPAGGYRVVGTNLSNPATPLVRYDVGDVADVTDETCDCGRPGRIVRRVDGRQEDYVILRNGARLGRMDHVFKDLTAIREAQIYQNTPGVMVVRVVRGAAYTENDEAALRREFHQRVGADADIRIEYVDHLPRTARGKLRFVVSEIDDGRLVK